MSSDIRKIILPAGRQFVDVSDVLTWIVEAKFPIPDGPSELSNLRKLVPQENPGGCREEDFDEGDVELLARIWQAVPGIWPLAVFGLLRVGETKKPRNPYQGEFEKFAQAFDMSPDRPAWELSPEFINYARQAEKRRQSAKQEHWGNMEREAAEGRIRLLGVSGAPTAKIDWQTQIPVEDARKYLADVPPGILLEVAPAEVAPEPVVTEGALSTSLSNRQLRMGNSTQERREDDLTPVIARVQQGCNDRYKTAEVWPALIALANSPDRPPVLLGVTSGGIMFRVPGGHNVLSRKNLYDRLYREKRMAQELASTR